MISDNGGFTVVGWYMRGIFNDKRLIDSQKIHNANGGNTDAKYTTNEEGMQNDSGKIIHHILSIFFQNHEFLDPTFQLGRDLGRFKFGVKEIEKTQLQDWTGAK